MFDIGWSELLVIAVVALIVIGPKELPGVLRNVGHWMGKVRRMAGEFQSQFQEAMREAEMADLKKHADDLNSVASSLSKPFDPTDYLGKIDEPTPSTSASTPTPGSAEATSTAPDAAVVSSSETATAALPAATEPPGAPAVASAPVDVAPAAKPEAVAPEPEPEAARSGGRSV
jgi:sec-independent protein translocase protein TatB